MRDSRRAPTALFAGLFDDAALFPPGNASMSTAVPAHGDYQGQWFAYMVGPFVCPIDRLHELDMIAYSARTSVASSVLATVEQLEALDEFARLRSRDVVATSPIVAAEVSGATFDDTHVEALARLARTIEVYAELDRRGDVGAQLDLLAACGVPAKYRTGGVTQNAVPPVGELASFIVGTVARDLPFKLTAGLHRAIRSTGPDGTTEAHGFLNVLLAVAWAVQGAPAPEVAQALCIRDPDSIRDSILGLDDKAVRSIRDSFRSMGTCSIDEPVSDLVALGLEDSV